MFSKRLSKRKLALLLSATLSTTLLIPSEFAFAAESSKSNESVLNYLESEDFIFTAERIPTNRWDTPANVHVITAEEIERNRYKDLFEALNTVNGISPYLAMETYGGTTLNGGHRVLLLINGHRLHNTQSGLDTHKMSTWGAIPSMKMIERIEFVKGAGSALYGTDAVDGIINIITKKGTRNETTVDVSYGTWSRRNFEVTNQGSEGKLSWFFSGNLARSNPWSGKTGVNILNQSYKDVRDYKNNGAYIRLDNRIDDRSSLTFDFLHHSRQNSGNVYMFLTANGQQVFDVGDTRVRFFQEQLHHRNDLYNNVAISYNFKEGTNTPGWLRFYDNYHSLNDFAEPVPLGKSTREDERIQGLEYQNGWEIGRHKIIAGLEWHKNIVNAPAVAINNRSVTNKAFYLQDTIRLGRKWIAIPGVRFDHSNDYGSQWSPKVAVNYRPDNKTKFYASYGRSFRAPNIAENYVMSQSPMLYVIGNAYTTRSDLLLRPEKGVTYTVGAEHNFDDRTNITLNLFRSNITEPIRFRNGYLRDTSGNIVPAAAALNLNQTEVYKGIELTFSQKLNEHFNYHLGFSNIRSEYGQYSNEQPIGYRAGISYQNRKFKASMLGLMKAGRLAEGIRTNTAEGTRVTYPADKSYAVFNLNLSYDVNDYVTTYMKILNFTNRDYGDIDYRYYPGRSFVLGAEAKF
ncbi:MAG: TonB-dependent receptor [Selenomonadaceae bacterium]|nr:TonB-dependent receptor [Selenomonadaceae bacterium]